MLKFFELFLSSIGNKKKSSPTEMHFKYSILPESKTAVCVHERLKKKHFDAVNLFVLLKYTKETFKK